MLTLTHTQTHTNTHKHTQRSPSSYQHSPTSSTSTYVTTLLTPHSVDPRVVLLLSSLLPPLCSTWRASSLLAAPSPPRLSGIAWQVGVPLASTSVSGESAAAVVQLETVQAGEEGRTVFQMTKGEVHTFLEGLEKIKEQLKKVV